MLDQTYNPAETTREAWVTKQQDPLNKRVPDRTFSQFTYCFTVSVRYYMFNKLTHLKKKKGTDIVDHYLNYNWYKNLFKMPFLLKVTE